MPLINNILDNLIKLGGAAIDQVIFNSSTYEQECGESEMVAVKSDKNTIKHNF